MDSISSHPAMQPGQQAGFGERLRNSKALLPTVAVLGVTTLALAAALVSGHISARDGVPEAQYAVNRAIDRTLRAFTWADLQALLKSAGLLRVPRHLALLRDVVRLAQADWPQLLHTAPPAMQRTVLQRLQGATALGL